jgi:acyl-CoA oxidase
MSNQINPDLAKERHDNLDIKALTKFLGETRFEKPGEYQAHLNLRDDLMKRIKPVFEENFYNLNRDEKYQMIMKKSLEICEYGREKNIEWSQLIRFASSPILGHEKFIFGLHVSAFMIPIELWGTEEQVKYWKKLASEKPVFGTYVQTEIGHGTYVRGLETTATYDRATREFIIESPTNTSIKFWPGAAGKTCNHAIVMAQLVIDGKEHGLHGFIVQLRSLEDHEIVPNLELGDIGMKYGFDTQDNGYLKFKQLRIPLFNMLMKHAVVTPEGEFKRVGNEMIMYACMLILRAILVQIATLNLSMTTTIAIRYSCVRRQTAAGDGKEPQIIEYKTQQYRLFPALATTYAYYFSSCRFINNMQVIKDTTNNFETIKPNELNMV